jgi:hypothetical protein
MVLHLLVGEYVVAKSSKPPAYNRGFFLLANAPFILPLWDDHLICLSFSSDDVGGYCHGIPLECLQWKLINES